MHPVKRSTRRRGFAYIAALILLLVFSSLGVAFATYSNLGLRKDNNYRAINDARLAAESGMTFMLRLADRIRLPGTTTQENFIANTIQVLGNELNETGNLAGAPITVDGSGVSVPQIELDSGAFSSRVTMVDADTCRLSVQGSSRGVTRTITIDLDLVPKQPRVFDFGLASKGKITLSGHAQIIGVNDPSEANILSATRDNTEAIHIDGNVAVSGDLAVCDENNNIVITGNPSIAGSTDPAVYAQHLHFGVPAPDFPELDTAPLEALATNVVDSTTDTNSHGQTFSNIRIAAGTNPTFASDVVINGVVYVEAPNVVKFEARTTLNGMVVTEDNEFDPETCKVTFAGRVEAYGVENLPDTAEFADVKEQTGTFILAPGFGVTFTGSFSQINGSVAAKQLTFGGTAEGTVNGSVIGLEDRMTKIDGNVKIFVDRSNADPNPAGFLKSFALIPDPGTYTELVEQ